MPKRETHSTRHIRLVLLLGFLAITVSVLVFRTRDRVGVSLGSLPATNALELLTRFEEAEAQKYWKPELEAADRGRVIEELWDTINRSEAKLSQLASALRETRITIAAVEPTRYAAHNVEISNPSSANTNLVDAHELLSAVQDKEWELERCEARFIGTSPDVFYISGHLTNKQTAGRAIVEGEVIVQFRTNALSIAHVDASKVELRRRSGSPPFSEMFRAEIAPRPGSYFIDPLIVWDLDEDGQVEVILAAANTVLRRNMKGEWNQEKLIDGDIGLIFGGILGDFSSNGTTDFLVVHFEGASIYEGTRDGKFSEKARPVWNTNPHLKYAQCFTAGDVDGDADLDLFLGQYKLPFDKGQMPFPYFEANDGFPSFLLINDGHGNFSDQTQSSGLAAKRGRRAYSTSLVDLDSDQDLDLVLVSDFAGLDVFENDGTGRFSDATRKWFNETHAFGMAHCFSDFNADGFLDLLLIGMNSPTVDRLTSAKLNRPYDISDEGMRRAVTFGNRLYFGNGNRKWLESGWGAKVARTGWSWGAAAADIDQDSFPDLYIANGHSTGASVHDYEPQFWLHDIYVGKSQENSLAASYFKQKLSRRAALGHSYGGHERNRLFLNERGTNFVEVAHLFGLAMEEDSRNTAWQDLDQDGKLDLIVTTFESFPKTRQTVRFFKNALPLEKRSLTVTLKDPRSIGASGKLVTDRTNAFAIVSGESYRTQLTPRLQLARPEQPAAETKFLGETNLFSIQDSQK